jgi:ankyrin repeat protein
MSKQCLALLLLAGCLGGCFKAPPENQLVNAARADDLRTFQQVAANYGSDINQPEKAMLGYTPLIAAVLSDGSSVFNYLLAVKANVNAPSRDGQTPLMMATMKGDINSNKVSALIKAGANVNARNQQGQSVLQHARAAGASNVVTILKDAGAQ